LHSLPTYSIRRSSNGRMRDFESRDRGSSPRRRARLNGQSSNGRTADSKPANRRSSRRWPANSCRGRAVRREVATLAYLGSSEARSADRRTKCARRASEPSPLRAACPMLPSSSARCRATVLYAVGRWFKSSLGDHTFVAQWIQSTELLPRVLQVRVLPRVPITTAV
jgi:hypothetical protein